MAPPVDFTAGAPTGTFDTAELFGAFSSPAATAAAAAAATTVASPSTFVAPLMQSPSPTASPNYSSLALYPHQHLLFQPTPTQQPLPLPQALAAHSAPAAAWALPSPALSQLASPLPPAALPLPAPTLALQPNLPPPWPSLLPQVPVPVLGDISHKTLLADLAIRNTLLAHFTSASGGGRGSLGVELPLDGIVANTRAAMDILVTTSPLPPAGATIDDARRSGLRLRPPSKAAAAGHEDANGGDTPRPRRFACPQQGCGKTFFRAQDLTRHQSVHGGAAAGWFVCPNAGCARRFGRADVANRHARLHCAVGRRTGAPAPPPPRRGRPPGSGGSRRKNLEAASVADVRPAVVAAGAQTCLDAMRVGSTAFSPAGSYADHC